MRDTITLLIDGQERAFHPVQREQGFQDSDCYDLVSPGG